MKTIRPNNSFLIILLLLIGFSVASAYLRPSPQAIGISGVAKPTETPSPSTAPQATASPTPELELLTTIAANGMPLKVGEAAKELQFQLTDHSATKVTCSTVDSADADLIVKVEPVASAAVYTVRISAAGRAIKGHQITLKCSNEFGSRDIVIPEIKPQVEGTDLTVVGLTGRPTELKLLTKQTLTMTVAADVMLRKEDEGNNSFSLVKGAGNTYLISGNAKSGNAVNIEAVSSEQVVPINGGPKFPVTVGQVDVKPNLSIEKDEPEEIEGPGKTVSFDPPDFKPSVQLQYSTQEPTFTIVPRTLDTEPPPTITGRESLFSRQVTIRGGTNFEPAAFSVSVVNKRYIVKINPPPDNAVYLGGSKLLLSAQVVDGDGNPAPQFPITWSLVTDTDKQYVSVPSSGQSILVSALKAPTEPNKTVAIQASSQVGPNRVVTDDIQIFVRGLRNVVDFRPIKVRIDMVDERTAKDLFGGRAEAEYYIAKIRIVNDLTQAEGGGPSSSVLFFSDALEVRVALQKKKIKNADKDWEPITKDDIYYANNWDVCEKDLQSDREKSKKKEGNERCRLDFEEALADCRLLNPDGGEAYTKCEIAAKRQLLSCMAEVETRLRNGLCGDDIDCINRNRFCAEALIQTKSGQDTFPSGLGDLRSGQWIPYWPFRYQIVANTHDRRADRSLRTRIFLGANVLSSGLSFFTSFLVPGPKSDLPLFLDKYQNFAIPTFEKLFPSMREVQRQNIISDILPPIVELPFGSDVSKYLFFPKKDIEGLLPNYKVRITSISSYRITVKVGIVQKATVQQGQ